MKLNWKRLGLVTAVLALVGLFVFSSAVFAKGPASLGWNGPSFGYGGPGFGMMGRWGWGGPAGSLIATAAEKLGMSQSELIQELQNGKTIAALAEEKGVNLNTIVDAVIAPQQTRLNALVQAGRLTQEQADALLALARSTVTDRLSQSFLSPFITATAEKLGIAPADLIKELQSGKTIAALAKEKGVNLDAIVDAILATLRPQITDRLNQPYGPWGWGKGWGMMGPHGHRGGHWGW
ncbi:MAG: hypothetical protein RML36_02240 [Anaerolineae bacterium]|nr:hypothetical protein [Anaerolineae bacterium]MDW8098287.1 hypothetical protein [Anaerolineae bacterium]